MRRRDEAGAPPASSGVPGQGELPMHADEQAIRALHASWIAAVNAGDLAALTGLMADDAVFLAPGQAVAGRDAFGAGFVQAHARFALRCASEPREVVVVGDLARTLSRDALSLRPRDGGPAIELAGDRLTIYRRQADGRWRLARDAHTLAPQAT
jgi:uncharacterized protein (TIGR02246 family)